MKINNNKGFTLIELLIVVAIIAILAAIAIPQFASYRMRAYNAAAESDIRNAKTGQESLFADNQTYGRTEGPIMTGAATNATGNGVLQTGSRVAATGIIAGATLSGPRASDGLAVATGIGVSNGVSLVSSSMAPVAPALSSSSYVIAAKHLQGDREFGTETESTALMYVMNETWVGTILTAAGAPATYPAAATLGLDVTGAGGGVPIAAWSPL